VTGDPLDRVTSGFQQPLRLAQPRAIEPLQRSGAGLLAEASAEGAGTHHRLGSDVFKPEFPVRVLFHPPQHRFKRRPIRWGRLVYDELRLPAVALQGHDSKSGGVGCHSRTMVLTDHVQTQIKPCGCTSGGQELPVVNEENIGIDIHFRISSRQLASCGPVGGCTQAVQQSSGRQGERSNADLIIVPGAAGPINEPANGRKIDTIPILLARTMETDFPALMRKALDNPRVTVATVCGGSLALAMAGLLEGRHAVTHHMGMDVLGATGAIPIHARVVDDGDLVTAGGVTSGLDLGLYLLERELGPRIARSVEELFEYERRGTTWHNKGLEAVAM